METLTIADFRRAANIAWPEHIAQDWDRVGLVSGRNTQPLTRVLLAVDVVSETVTEACDWNADVLFTHHPLLLRGITTVAADTAKGSLLTQLIESRCALYAAHTNADAPKHGVSDVLAERFGLIDSVPIEPNADPTSGIGRVGTLAQPLTLQQLAYRIATVIPPTTTGVRVAGKPDQIISRVALCGGAGDSLLTHPLVKSADVYVTSDLRHHPAQESLEASAIHAGPALIDIPHWASESVWLDGAAEWLSEQLPGVEFRVSRINTDPWAFTVS